MRDEYDISDLNPKKNPYVKGGKNQPDSEKDKEKDAEEEERD